MARLTITAALIYNSEMNSEISKYLKRIASKGGSKNSGPQIDARAENLKLAQAKRRIVDEFSHIADRQRRYQLRQAKKAASVINTTENKS